MIVTVTRGSWATFRYFRLWTSVLMSTWSSSASTHITWVMGWPPGSRVVKAAKFLSLARSLTFWSSMATGYSASRALGLGGCRRTGVVPARRAGCGQAGRAWSGWPAPLECLAHPRRGPTMVGRVEVLARGHDLVDLVQDGVLQADVSGLQHPGQLFHGPGPDDGRGDGRVGEHEGHRHLGEAVASLARQLGERVHRGQLCLVGRVFQVVAVGQARRPAAGVVPAGAEAA